MKHLFNFTHIVTVAFFAAACVFGFSACNDEVAEQEKITQDVKQELQQEIKDLNDSIDALEREVDDYVKTMQKTNDSIQSVLNHRIDSLGTVVSGITPCTCDFHHWQDVVDYVNATIQPYWDSTMVKNWVASQIGAFVTVTQLTDSLNVIRTTINSLSTRLDGVDITIVGIQGDITNINNHLKNHCDSLTSAYAEIYRIRDSLATVTSNLQATITAVTTIANNALTTATHALDTTRIVGTTANLALTTANNAQTAANNAQTAADNAQTTANTALTNAATAQAAADFAQTTANNAQTAANNAQTAANNAQTTANDALASANSAWDTIRIVAATADAAWAKALVNETNITNMNVTINGMSKSIDSLRHTSAYLVDLAHYDSARIDNLFNFYNQLTVTDDSLAKQIDTIKIRMQDFATKTQLKDSMTAMRVYADTLHARALHYADSLFALIKPQLNALDARIATLEAGKHIVDSTLNAHTATLNAHNDSIAALRNDINTLRTDLNTLAAQVLLNTQKITKLEKSVVDLRTFVTDVFTKTIYSVILQGSYNPVFGYFAMPFGAQSNVLMAYYGENEHKTYFPPYIHTSDLVYNEYALTDGDALMLGSSVESFTPAGQTPFLSNEGNAGKMYFTVNPSTVDLTNATFTLVNSLGKEAGIKLDTVKASSDKLTFGYTGTYTRQKAPFAGASSPNGFYEANGIIRGADDYETDQNIAIAKIQVDPELKQAVKDFYNANFRNASGASDVISNLDPSSFTELANGIYQQFNGFADAYALKAHWTDSLGAHDVYSNYGMAAMAVKPLSYAFLKDKSMKKLPTITPISEFTGFNLNMSNINFNINFKIDTAQANIHLTAFHINLTGLYAEVSVPKYDPATASTTDTIIVAELDSLASTLNNYFNNQFDSTIDGWNANINNEINQQVNALIKEINNQVNSFVGNIEGQLNTQIQDVIDDAQGQVLSKINNAIGKVNTYIGKVNRVINKVNRLISNPNRFMQPVLLYEGADNHFHFVSTSKSIPSVFTGSGAIVLHPTSYNAEIVAPAYKKFIAVTNVFKNGKSAQGGDSDCIGALNAANSKPNFNQVIDGGRYGVAFVPQSGYTYEIFYSALDFSGRISQRKYYVTVQ